MTSRERNDAIFRSALTPAADQTTWSGLAESIHEAIQSTSQRPVPTRWSVGRGAVVPTIRPLLGALLIVALIALVGLLAILAARPASDPFATMYRGGPERNGVMPGPGPVGNPEIIWRAELAGAVTVMPAVVDGVVYITDQSGAVRALDAATSEPRWRVERGGPVDGSPAVAGGLVFVGTKAGAVVALETSTGRTAWTFRTTGPVRAGPAIVGDTLYDGSEDGQVFALDRVTGRPRWATQVGAPVTRGPAVADGVVYAGGTGGQFFALSAADGRILWSKRDLGPGEVGTPMVADGLVFVASGLLEEGPSDRITALDIRDGSERWTFTLPDGLPVYNGAVTDGSIYVGSANGGVYRLDEQTGRQVTGWPFVTGGAVGYLSGITDGVLYIPSDDGLIHAVDAVTGIERWKIAVRGLPNAPVVVDGRIFVGSDAGVLYAIGGAGSTPSGTR